MSSIRFQSMGPSSILVPPTGPRNQLKDRRQFQTVERQKKTLVNGNGGEIREISEIDNRMAEDNSKQIVPPKYDVNAKWDACLDLTVRRFFYSSLGGAFAGLLFFRSPVTRWASVAFGAGLGIGSAYTDCSHLFDGSPAKLPSPKIIDAPASQDGHDSHE